VREFTHCVVLSRVDLLRMDSGGGCGGNGMAIGAAGECDGCGAWRWGEFLLDWRKWRGTVSEMGAGARFSGE
jgi:hypothetical protein